MVRYQCQICKRCFSSHGGLTQHANAKHQGRMSLFQQNENVQHDERLWSTPITMTSSASSSQEKFASQDEMEDIAFDDTIQDLEEVVTGEKPSYNLRKRARLENIEERVIENVEESEIESPVNLEDIDPEDLQGASLDDALDAIEGKNAPERVAKWPNDAYRDFMELIVDGNISNKTGDKIIKFFNKYSNLEKSPLPSSTKTGKDYLNQINSPSIDFKEKVVETYNEVNFTLYYRPIFRAIQALLQRPEVANNFVYKGNIKKMKVSLIICVSAIKG